MWLGKRVKKMLHTNYIAVRKRSIILLMSLNFSLVLLLILSMSNQQSKLRNMGGLKLKTEGILL